MKEKFSEMIKMMHQRKSVENICTAIDSYDAYLEEESFFKREITAIKAMAEELEECEDFFLGEYQFTADDSIEICLICIMTGVEECEYFSNREELVVALRSVEGDYKKVAMKLADFIADDGECDFFSLHPKKKVIRKLFSFK